MTTNNQQQEETGGRKKSRSLSMATTLISSQQQLPPQQQILQSPQPLQQQQTPSQQQLLILSSVSVGSPSSPMKTHVKQSSMSDVLIPTEELRSKKKRPTRPIPALPTPLIRPKRKAPVPPYLFKQTDGYTIQEAADTDESLEYELQDFNFLPIYASKIRDQPHSLFLGDSPVFGIVVVAILHPDLGRKKVPPPDRRLMMHKFSRKSLKADEEEEEEANDEIQMDVFIRGVPGDVFFSIPIRGLKASYNRRQLIKEFQEHVKDYQDTSFELIKDPQLMTDLGTFEQNLIQKKYKFGLLLRTQEAADDENAIFSIKNTTPDFEEFLEFLGERVVLQGFKKYNAGLDTSANLDGTHSVYTTFRDFELMWHVCPLLLYSDSNPQQIQRKRHIGNDVCVLIFDEADTPLDPNMLTSKFNHVQVIIKKKKDMSDDKRTFYEIGVASKKGVGEHLPLPPKSRIFEKGTELREFLYTKMLNAERASYLALAFAKAISRTREGLLKANIWDKYHHE